MDYDDLSPAAKYFDDDSFVLVGTVRDLGAMLWLSFDETTAYVNLGVYDYIGSHYPYQFKGSTAEDVREFIAELEAEYNVTIPPHYAATVTKFLELRGNSFGIRETLDTNSSPCDGCADIDRNEVEAFYFPPLGENDNGSIAVHWEYGCYGGETIAGDAGNKRVVKNVRSLLERAADNAEKESYATPLREFLNKLEKVAPVGK